MIGDIKQINPLTDYELRITDFEFEQSFAHTPFLKKKEITDGAR